MTIITAKVSEVKIGPLTMQGLMSDQGEFGVAVPQIAEHFQILSNNASRDLKALCRGGFQFLKWATPLSPKSVNVLLISDLANVCYQLSVSGRDTTGNAHEVAKAYYLENGDHERVSVLDGLRALEKSNHKALRSRTNSQRERDIQEKYAVMWGCEKEYPVECQRSIGTLKVRPVSIGRADLVSPKILAEVKVCRQWKHAMGQLLAYQEVLQRQEIWLILFNSKNQPQDEIRSIVGRFGIKVKFIRN